MTSHVGQCEKKRQNDLQMSPGEAKEEMQIDGWRLKGKRRADRRVLVKARSSDTPMLKS